MTRSFVNHSVSPLFMILIGLVCLFFLSGCEDRQATETSMFEAAEVNYREGDYSAALEGYQDFLRRYPASPLATTAEMRVRNIRREVSSLMERTGSPRPTYHGSRRSQSKAESSEISDHPEEERRED